MKIVEIAVTFEATQNLHDYSIVHPGVRLTARLEENDDPDDVQARLFNEARATVQSEIDEALIADDQPPRYYVGPRFMVMGMFSNETRRIIILPDETDLKSKLQRPAGWEFHVPDIRPNRRMRLDQARNIAVRVAKEYDDDLIVVMDCHDGDLSRLSDIESGTLASIGEIDDDE